MPRAFCPAEIGIIKDLGAAYIVKIRGIGHGHVVFGAGNFVDIQFFQMVAITQKVGQTLIDLGGGFLLLNDGLEGVEAEGVVHHDVELMGQLSDLVIAFDSYFLGTIALAFGNIRDFLEDTL